MSLSGQVSSLCSGLMLVVEVGLGSLTIVLGVVSFGSPFWLVPGAQHNAPYITLGLWLACLDDTCVSVFDDGNKIASVLGDWFYVVQTVTSISLVLTVLVALCMRGYCCQRNPNLLLWATRFTLLASVAFTTGIIVFGVDSSKHHLVDGELSGLMFGSSFYCGIGASICGIIMVIILGAHYRQNQARRRQYELLLGAQTIITQPRNMSAYPAT